MGIMNRIAMKLLHIERDEYFQSLICQLLRETGDISMPMKKVGYKHLIKSTDFYVMEVVDGVATFKVLPVIEKAKVTDIKTKVRL